MANGTRSIYSREQAMRPGQYDTSLADFLSRLPDYYAQLEGVKLAREKQASDLEQRKINNELNTIRLLPENARVEALASSEIPEIKDLGTGLKIKNQGFADTLNDVYTSNVGNSSAIYSGLENLLTDNDIAMNPSYVKQIKERMAVERPKVAREGVFAWAKDNPNDPRVSQLIAMAKFDPEKAMSTMMPPKSFISTNQQGVYFPHTKTYGFATDTEIEESKLTETKEDDMIPISGAPRQGGGSTLSLTQINKAITDVQNALNPRKRRQSQRPELTTEQREKLLLRLDAFERQRDSLFGLTEKKTIPGF